MADEIGAGSAVLLAVGVAAQVVAQAGGPFAFETGLVERVSSRIGGATIGALGIGEVV